MIKQHTYSISVENLKTGKWSMAEIAIEHDQFMDMGEVIKHIEDSGVLMDGCVVASLGLLGIEDVSVGGEND